MTRLDGTGVCLRLAGEQEAAYTTLPRPLTEVDAGTCHGSLRPFLAHETETLVWRARPLSCVGVRTLPNDHAYVISMQPGRAWTHLLDNNRACTSRGRVSTAHARSCAPYGTQLMHGHVRRTAVQCVSVLTAAGGYRRTPGSEATMDGTTNVNAKRPGDTLDHFLSKQPRQVRTSGPSTISPPPPKTTRTRVSDQRLWQGNFWILAMVLLDSVGAEL